MELVVKNPPAHAGDIRDTGSIPGLGRSPRGGHDNPLKYSCLENSMDRGSWQATIHRVAKSQTRLSDFTFTFERNAVSISGSERCPGGGYGNPLKYSCLENSMDRGAWWAMVHKESLWSIKNHT